MMSKKQLIQLLQFIIIWVLLWLFVVFVLEESFIDFILRYWLYLLIVSFSYFYYYSIEYEPDKKYELIRNVLIYGNLYLFLHIFFRPLLNVSHQLFVLLWLIILWLWWTTKLISRWRYVLQVIWWIFVFFILISGMFYFYPEEPDIEWFLKVKSDEIRVLWVDSLVEKTDAYVHVVDSRWANDFDIVPGFTKILSENVKISYPSLKSQRDEKLVIITSFWDLIRIFPQSEVQVEFDWNNLIWVSKLNWKIWFLSWVFNSDVKVSWYEENLTQDQLDFINWAQSMYKSELVSYLKNQISDSKIGRANNTIMYDIDGRIIRLLVKLFPISFGKNLRNYNEFQKYFGLADGWVDLGRYEMKQWTWWSITSVWWSVKGNMSVWKDNTYGIFKKPENR